MSAGEAFFVTLGRYNATVNLAAIVLVDWSVEAVPEEWAEAGYVATVQLANRSCIYIDAEDAMELQSAMYDYNATTGKDTSSRNRVLFQPQKTGSESAAEVAVVNKGNRDRNNNSSVGGGRSNSAG
jgi:hypothetical protein